MTNNFYNLYCLFTKKNSQYLAFFYTVHNTVMLSATPYTIKHSWENTEKKRIKSERRNRLAVNVPDALSGRQG